MTKYEELFRFIEWPENSGPSGIGQKLNTTSIGPQKNFLVIDAKEDNGISIGIKRKLNSSMRDPKTYNLELKENIFCQTNSPFFFIQNVIENCKQKIDENTGINLEDFLIWFKNEEVDLKEFEKKFEKYK